ncbi:ADP-ribosyltransferase [Nocardia sp. R6R-6]|uniref:ADP-ribosyltransferase n=1 Tax=Nocardia sp. R6R-6 TaxID=3459303 RepID=UPI00403D5D6D
MTVIDVSVPTYYDTAAKLATAAADFWAAVDAEWPAMAQATNMAGSYSDAKKWGESYDNRAAEILRLVSKLANAAHGYAVILQQVGYNHECAEFAATIGTGPLPTRPAAPLPPVIVCRIPLPSAGGPGNGLVDSGIGLAEMIGIIVPDGNATTISNAGNTWERTARAAAVAGFPAALQSAATALESITAPESAFVDEDLRALKAAADAAITAMTDLAASCRAHRQALDELRDNLRMQLEAIRDALLTELAINAAISLASSWITFGVSAAVGLAGAAAICARYARPIRLMIEQWQNERRIAAGVKLDADIQRHVREVERLEDLTPGGRLRPKADPAAASLLNDADRAALWEYTGPGGSESLNYVLRHGGINRAQELRVTDLNAALDKLPDYQGLVTRRADLTPEDLARYQPGHTVTEAGFTSSSRAPEAAFDRQVEFRIVSEHGKSIEQFARKPEELEVLFKSGTEFNVLNRYPDPETGRIIIEMAEEI